MHKEAAHTSGLLQGQVTCSWGCASSNVLVVQPIAWLDADNQEVHQEAERALLVQDQTAKGSTATIWLANWPLQICC